MILFTVCIEYVPSICRNIGTLYKSTSMCPLSNTCTVHIPRSRCVLKGFHIKKHTQNPIHSTNSIHALISSQLLKEVLHNNYITLHHRIQ